MTSSPIDLNRLTAADEIRGESENETELLRDAQRDAENYLKSFQWFPGIAESYLGLGIGGIVGVFLFKLQRAVHGKDEWLWVVVGDLPSAYMVVDDAHDAMSALALYCDMMDEWVDAVKAGRSLDGVFPVTAPATLDNAEMLESRIEFIRERILV